MTRSPPVACAVCGSTLRHPPRGRPRLYCPDPCSYQAKQAKRRAEYVAQKRAQQEARP